MPQSPRRSQIEAMFERFLAVHGVADEEQFEAWAMRQPEMREDPTILGENAWGQLEDWLGLGSSTASEEAQAEPDEPSLISLVRETGRGKLDLQETSEGPRSLREGDRVGGFRLDRFIAQGGMGQVWEAHDENLRRIVALKVVLPERVDEDSLALFAREARAGGRLSHPNIVTTLAHGSDEGLAWIAQELIEGSWTIKDFLDELRSEDCVPKGYYREVAHLVAQVADGLQAAHDEGVIHRDVKPRNILIAKDDTPQLTDFGLARVSDDSFRSNTGQFAGTWAYMSPEQVTARRMGLDHRTDIFSLGVVLYEMLTLRRPFEGDTTHQIAEQIIAVDPPNPSEVRSQCPIELAVIAGKALEKAPGHRYQTMTEFAADLRCHLNHEPIIARPPSPWMRVAKWVRRNPTKSTVAVIAASATVAIAFVGTLAVRNAERARTSQHEAEKQAEIATARLDDVLSLSAARDLGALIERADGLWPAHPVMIPRYEAWLEDARLLLEGQAADPDRGRKARPSLAQHKLKLAELRSRAVRDTEPDTLAEFHAHARYPELVAARRERGWRARMLGVEPWPDLVQGEAALAREKLPEDGRSLNGLAWSLVNPAAPRHGEELRGLLIAERALDRVEESGRVATLDTLAWALFRMGRLEEAQVRGEEALAAARDNEVDESQASLLAATERWRGAALPVRRAELAQLDLVIEGLAIEVGELTFADLDDAWWQRQLWTLITDLQQLRDPDTGLMGDTVAEPFGWGVTRRLEFARELVVRGKRDMQERAQWREVITAIAASSTYGGLTLTSQVGLLPIGRDEDSGLWEFAHLQSGAPAVRGDDGKLVLTEDTGMVFVLIPGGTFMMGAQDTNDEGVNYDPHVGSDEGPPHAIELSAYFLSKYEMTQGQWVRLAGSNPSRDGPEGYRRSNRDGDGWSALIPVEEVSWWDCLSMMDRLGLVLPSEARWEHGCRAGTDSVFWTGDDPLSLGGAANVADAYAKAHGGRFWVVEMGLDDGHVSNAKVGTFEPNAFGLHDVHGNVWEPCLDGYASGFFGPGRPRDPVVPWKGSARRVLRGGAFNIGPSVSRAANRYDELPDYHSVTNGLRPARDITP